MTVFMKNNNIYGEYIRREKAKKRSEEQGVKDATRDQGVVDEIVSLWNDICWSIQLHAKYTIAPIVKISPSFFFRISSYCIILTYLSDFYNGVGLFLPLFLFVAVTGLNLSLIHI